VDQHDARRQPSRRRGGRALRLAAVVVALALVALGGGSSSVHLPSPRIQPVSVTDPVPPTDVVVTSADRALAVSWTASTESFVSGYRVYLDGVLAASPATTSASITSLVNGRSYVVTVRTVTTVLNSSYEGTTASSPVIGTPRDSVPPAAPLGVAADRGDARVTLSWTANSADHDVDGYRVLRDGAPVTGLLSGAGTTGYIDTGLVNDQTYGYTVQTHDTSGNWSVSSSPVALATPTDLTAPAAPTGLVAIRGDGQVSLSWSANGEPDVASYRVLRNGVEVATVTGTEHVDTGLVNDTPYVYSLVAVDRHGNRSAESESVSATPTDVAAAAPTGVTASPGDRQAYVRWSAAPEPDVVEHRILAEDGSTAATATAPATQVTVTGLTNGTVYRFTVVAVDAGGNVSAPSASVAVVPALGVVPAEGAGESGGLAVSGDGRFVVVGTRARLEPADTNTAYELHLVDREAGTTRRIAPLPATASGATDPTNTSAPAISDDGRYVVLATTAALLPGDTNRLADVYRLDTRSGAWALVSVPAGGKVSAVAGTLLHTGPSVYATSPTVVVSADGDLVLFYSARAE
jgi:chitodextrinase